MSDDTNSGPEADDGIDLKHFRKMIGCLPYADHNVGIPETMAAMTRAADEIAALRERADKAEAAYENEDRDHEATVKERDSAEEALSQMFYLVTGRSPEWSNHFGHQHAIEEVSEAQEALRAEIAALRADVKALNRLAWAYHGLAVECETVGGDTGGANRELTLALEEAEDVMNRNPLIGGE